MMEKQSRWSEQRSEQRTQQQHTERREQVVQQEERVQRTEHHYTRQMLTQQRGQFDVQTITPYRAFTLAIDYPKFNSCYSEIVYTLRIIIVSHPKLRAPAGRSSARRSASGARLRVSLVSSWCVTLFVHSAFPRSKILRLFWGARGRRPASARTRARARPTGMCSRHHSYIFHTCFS